jgi:hypothetical protein
MFRTLCSIVPTPMIGTIAYHRFHRLPLHRVHLHRLYTKNSFTPQVPGDENAEVGSES